MKRIRRFDQLTTDLGQQIETSYSFHSNRSKVTEKYYYQCDSWSHEQYIPYHILIVLHNSFGTDLHMIITIYEPCKTPDPWQEAK